MNIIADTCFWISLCDPLEENHEDAVKMMDKITHDKHISILVPHPVLYESLCSRMVRKPDQVQTLARYFTQVEQVADERYVGEAYRLVVAQAEDGKGMASMTDIVIMLMAEDPVNQIKGIITSNGRDFAQFCQKRNMRMIATYNILCTV